MLHELENTQAENPHDMHIKCLTKIFTISKTDGHWLCSFANCLITSHLIRHFITVLSNVLLSVLLSDL